MFQVKINIIVVSPIVAYFFPFFLRKNSFTPIHLILVSDVQKEIVL